MVPKLERKVRWVRSDQASGLFRPFGFSALLVSLYLVSLAEWRLRDFGETEMSCASTAGEVPVDNMTLFVLD